MLQTDHTILLVVDVQGKLAQLMSDRETLFANLRRMIRGARALDIPVLWAEQLPHKLGPSIPEVAEELADQQPICKETFSCCDDEQFNAAFAASGRRQVLLTGIETHICVYQTARDLLDRGCTVELVADATSSRIPGNKTVGMAKMQALGAGLTSTEMALFELMRTAAHPAFRTIQGIVK
jgi:nicotinamidase-related amidase